MPLPQVPVSHLSFEFANISLYVGYSESLQVEQGKLKGDHEDQDRVDDSSLIDTVARIKSW
jgi:hypothetical protein